jgi:hypothetical protein
LTNIKCFLQKSDKYTQKKFYIRNVQLHAVVDFYQNASSFFYQRMSESIKLLLYTWQLENCGPQDQIWNRTAPFSVGSLSTEPWANKHLRSRGTVFLIFIFYKPFLRRHLSRPQSCPCSLARFRRSSPSK